MLGPRVVTVPESFYLWTVPYTIPEDVWRGYLWSLENAFADPEAAFRHSMESYVILKAGPYKLKRRQDLEMLVWQVRNLAVKCGESEEVRR